MELWRLTKESDKNWTKKKLRGAFGTRKKPKPLIPYLVKIIQKYEKPGYCIVFSKGERRVLEDMSKKLGFSHVERFFMCIFGYKVTGLINGAHPVFVDGNPHKCIADIKPNEAYLAIQILPRN